MEGGGGRIDGGGAVAAQALLLDHSWREQGRRTERERERMGERGRVVCLSLVFPIGGAMWPACESEASHVACGARSQSATTPFVSHPEGSN